MCNGNGYQAQHTTTSGYSWSVSGQWCSGAARHIDAVNNGRQDIDQNYTAALTLKFAKVAVFNVWLLLVILCVNYLRHRCNILQLVGRALEPKELLACQYPIPLG